MEVRVNKNRKIYCSYKIGTQNENETTVLKIQVPEEYQDFHKKIVFITSDGVFWDVIENDTYSIRNVIAKYENVKFYIWLTKNDKDFRSEEKEVTFNKNVAVESQITEEEISGIARILDQLEINTARIDSMESIIGDISSILDHINGEVV